MSFAQTAFVFFFLRTKTERNSFALTRVLKPSTLARKRRTVVDALRFSRLSGYVVTEDVDRGKTQFSPNSTSFYIL